MKKVSFILFFCVLITNLVSAQTSGNWLPSTYPDGIYAYPQDPQSYVLIDNGVQYLFHCIPGTMFDVQTSRCEIMTEGVRKESQACSVWAYVAISGGSEVGVGVSREAIAELNLSVSYTIEYKLVAGHQDICVTGGSYESCQDVIGFWNSIWGTTGDCVPDLAS